MSNLKQKQNKLGHFSSLEELVEDLKLTFEPLGFTVSKGTERTEPSEKFSVKFMNSNNQEEEFHTHYIRKSFRKQMKYIKNLYRSIDKQKVIEFLKRNKYTVLILLILVLGFYWFGI